MFYHLVATKGCDSMTWLFLAVAGIAAYFLIKGKKINISGTNEAEEALKRRYIDGEIDEETYLKMKEIIKK